MSLTVYYWYKLVSVSKCKPEKNKQAMFQVEKKAKTKTI